MLCILLLQAGASLESLAKGAVQFTRRFTVEELQHRWHSLLYDPDISLEASSRMLEYERSCTALPSKLSRPGNSKESKSSHGKRKVESVRNGYYALRKRIRNEPFNSMDLSFLASNDSIFGNDDEPMSGNCMLDDPISNPFGLEESHLDIMHNSFPAISGNGIPSSGNGHVGLDFHGGPDHPVEDGFTMQQDDMHAEIPHIFDEHQPFTGNDCGVADLGESKPVPGLFDTDHLEANPTSEFGHMDNGAGNVCSDFDGNQVFHSAIPECGVSFPELEYTSPLPEMPMWRTAEDISSPSIPVDDSHTEQNLHAADTAFTLPDDGDAKDTSTQGCDLVHENSNLKMEMPCDDMKCPTGAAEGYLAELSNSLLDFNDDELLTLDDDEKGMIDKSFFDGLNLFLNSPNDANQDQVPSPEPKASVAPEHISNASTSCPVKSVESVQMQSLKSASDPRFPELINGVICCELNTEDPEIPCNDDVFLLNRAQQMSVSATRRNFKEASNSVSCFGRDFSGNKKPSDVGTGLMQREQGNPAQCQASSKLMGSQAIAEKGKLQAVGQAGVKFGLPNGDLGSRKLGISCGGPNQLNSVTESHQPGKLKEDNTNGALVKNNGQTSTDFLMDKTTFGSDSFKRHEKTSSVVRQESDDPATNQGCNGTITHFGSANIPESEQDINNSISEPEEPIESDDDVPYFSDIEAMVILIFDLQISLQSLWICLINLLQNIDPFNQFNFISDT